jgi:ribosomal protein S18
MFSFETEKPATFINRPLTRGQIRRRYMRSVSKKDLDWKNTALITKFINESGKLYNRYQSRLETPVHHKVAKTVKKMRHLGILPWVGVVKQTDKVPIGSYIENIEEMHRKTIDPVTGRLFLKHSLTDDLREKQKRLEDQHKQKFEGVEGTKEFTESTRFNMNKAQDRVIREMGIDVDRIYPNRRQKQWLAAQAYIVE